MMKAVSNGSEFDLGPMRILGSRFIRDGGKGHHFLTLSAAGSTIEIIVSGGGNNVRILKDGTELLSPEQLE